jgi:hypothetical protein
MSDYLELLETTDAAVWAKAFTERWGLFTPDGVVADAEGLMLSWFANAIETGRTAGLLASVDDRQLDVERDQIRAGVEQIAARRILRGET